MINQTLPGHNNLVDVQVKTKLSSYYTYYSSNALVRHLDLLVSLKVLWIKTVNIKYDIYGKWNSFLFSYRIQHPFEANFCNLEFGMCAKIKHFLCDWKDFSIECPPCTRCQTIGFSIDRSTMFLAN